MNNNNDNSNSPLKKAYNEMLETITARISEPYLDYGVIGDSDAQYYMIGEGFKTPEELTEDFQANQTSNIPGFKETTNFKPKYTQQQIDSRRKKSLISKFFSNMSRLGMSYEEKVIDNMRAIPADKSLLSKENQLMTQSLFGSLGSNWKQKSNADKNFYEKDYALKREALRKLATQPELEDILDTMTNECVVYDANNTYFLEPYLNPTDLSYFKKSTQKKINNSINNSFSRLYKMLEWRTRAWDDFKRFLIEGILAWEIVYDSLEKPTKIIGLVPLDPATLTKKFDNNKWYWVQFKGVNGKERTLLDAQVIYIQYQETNVITRLSYLERLIRPFNIYRIIEQAQLIWTITNASYKMKFTIPVKGMNRANGAQTLASAMNRYKEDIKFVQDTGELQINGQVNMPFNKEYWMPESDAGSPNIEVLGGEGPELSDNDQLSYFRNQLYKISKIPLDRFDSESGSTWFGTEASDYLRTEIAFGRFVTRLRNTFVQIIIKPVTIQLALDMPELQDDRDFLNSIQMEWKSYNEFQEMLQIDLMQKRIEFIETMKNSLVDQNEATGSEVKFFSSKFLVQKYLHLSDADVKLNDKLKQEEIEDLGLHDDPTAEDDGEDGMGFESIDNQLKQLEATIKESKDKIKHLHKKRIKKDKKAAENDDSINTNNNKEEE